MHHSITTGIKSILAAVAIPLAAGAATVPTPKKTVAPNTDSIANDLSGVVNVVVDINKYGFVTDASIQDSTHPELEFPALDAIRQWTFVPADENGEAIASKAVQPFYFNQGSIVLKKKKAPADTHPIASKRVQPELTDDLRNITGTVVLQASIDASGQVQDVEVKNSTHAELESAASAALAKWNFKPAISSGEAVASQVIVPFKFEASQKDWSKQTIAKAKNVDRAPIAVRKPTPDLPSELSQERGEAKLQLTVDEFGYVASADVIESSNDSLSSAARKAALQWKFKPAIKDGAAVASTVIQPFSFNGGLLTADLPVDSMPVVKRSKSPELPEALVNVQGYVKVRLDLDARGNVLNASCTKSSHEELEAPTVEAAKAWTFKPAVRDGEKVPSSVVVPFVYGKS